MIEGRTLGNRFTEFRRPVPSFFYQVTVDSRNGIEINEEINDALLFLDRNRFASVIFVSSIAVE